MAKVSLLDDLFSLAMKIPWWVSFTIAVVVFFGLDIVSTMEAPPKSADLVGDTVKHSLITSLATWFKIIIPFPFIIGGIFSLIKSLSKK